MEFRYTIDDLASMAHKTKQSIYTLLSKNKELTEANSKRQNRKIYYSQEVADYVLSYYGISSTPEDPEIAPITAREAQEDKQAIQALQEQISVLESQIAALKNELTGKDKEIEELKEEKTELIKQNGLTLLLLQEEKAEKQKLLPAPRAGLFAKIRNIFNKEN